jgi:hypothetical protein
MDASTKAPSAVKMRQLGPLLHRPKQLTLTTGTVGGVKNVNVAIVASLPFSRHHRFAQTKIWAPPPVFGTTIERTPTATNSSANTHIDDTRNMFMYEELVQR